MDSMPDVIATPPQGVRAMNGPPRTLSSARTFFSKIIFPTFWIGGFCLSTLKLFLSPAPAPLRWIFLFGTAVGTLFLWWICFPLKRVRMDDQALYISNFKTEIAVPLHNVAEVTENYWLNDHPVTIRFHSGTGFGTKIVFVPKQGWFTWWWSSHPVVAEIRGAVARASGAGPVIPGDPQERHQPGGL
jgi:hypothetical protein